MQPPKNYITDMDGVLVSGRTMIPGADKFIEKLKARDAEYLVLTNNSLYTPRDLAHRLSITGLHIPPERIYIEFSSPARHMWGWNSRTF